MDVREDDRMLQMTHKLGRKYHATGNVPSVASLTSNKDKYHQY